MKKFESVVIVGSSGAGKTTLVNGLRAPEHSEKIVIPQRYVTRPERAADDLRENAHTDWQVFWSMVNRGLLNPHWNRTLERGRQEGYGFELVEEGDERLRVYSANNAFLINPNFSVRTVLERALVVGVTSDIEVRESRLMERSPDMSDAERAVRLGDDGTAALAAAPGAVEIIDTSGLTLQEGQLAMVDIVQAINA